MNRPNSGAATASTPVWPAPARRAANAACPIRFDIIMRRAPKRSDIHPNRSLPQMPAVASVPSADSAEAFAMPLFTRCASTCGRMAL